MRRNRWQVRLLQTTIVLAWAAAIIGVCWVVAPRFHTLPLPWKVVIGYVALCLTFASVVIINNGLPGRLKIIRHEWPEDHTHAEERELSSEGGQSKDVPPNPQEPLHVRGIPDPDRVGHDHW